MEAGIEGLLVEVRWEWDGTETVTDLPAGTETFEVNDVLSLSVDDVVWVGDDLGPYVVVDQDEDADTITLNQPIPVDIEEATPIIPDAGGGPGQIWVAEVVLPDSEEPIEVPLTIHDLAVMPEGIYDPPKNIMISEDLEQVIDLPGTLPSIPGEYIPPDTIPDPTTPTDPPAASPDISVTGTLDGLVVHAENVAPTTLIEYHITDDPPVDPDGNPLPFDPTPETMYGDPTRSQDVFITHLPNGDPLDLEKAYYLRTVATNVVGSALPGLMTSGALDPKNASTVVTGKVQAGFGLFGEITVGQIKISPNQGIVIPQATDDGGMIRLPADGSPATFTGEIESSRMTVKDNLTINGQANKVAGSLVLENGVTAPTQQLSMSRDWPFMQRPEDGFESTYIGLTFTDNPDTYATTANLFGIGIHLVNRTTGLSAGSKDLNITKNLGNGFTAIGVSHGIARYGNVYHVLVELDGDWFVYRYNNDLDYLGRWSISMTVSHTAAIGTDDQNGGIILGWTTPSGNLYCRTYLADGTQNVTRNLTHNGVTRQVRAIYNGPADFGVAYRTIVTWEGSSENFLAYSWTTRTPANDFPRGFNANVKGLMWDGSHFYSLDNTGRFIRYLPDMGETTISGTFSWYDSNPLGDGTHETQAGPPNTFDLPRRSRLRVSASPPNDTGGVDDPDEVRIYLNNSRQPGPGKTTGGNPIISVAYEDIDFEGDAAPTSNGFATAETRPGAVVSLATRMDGTPRFAANGAGEGRFDGLIPPGTVVETLRTTAPPGWLMMDGTLYSASLYPDLADAVPHLVSGGYIGLPNMTDRVARGASTPSSTGATGGSNTVTMPGHEHGAAGLSTANAGLHNHTSASMNKQSNTAVGGNAIRIVSGSTDNDGVHSHNVVGTTGGIIGSNPPIGNVPSHATFNYLIKY